MKPGDPRQHRRRRRISQLLETAWEIAEQDGIAAVGLREVARRVGLRQPSLYGYFDSKAGLYDLMFAQAAEQLFEEITTVPWPEDPGRALELVTEAIVRWNAAKPARQQLLFQRVLPGFEPSPASYEPAVRFLEWTRTVLARAGLTDPADVDLYTAIVAGLALQQIANDPGGDRWTARSGEAVRMLMRHSRARTGGVHLARTD